MNPKQRKTAIKHRKKAARYRERRLEQAQSQTGAAARPAARRAGA